MLATVLITNHDFGRWLPQAVDSALAQTHAQTEVVVVDDGSTDDSREVLARYGDRITTVLQDNQGQGAAVNAGVAVSRGHVVCLLDSDDVLLPHKVERVVGALRPGVSIVQHPLQQVDADGRPLGHPTPRRLLEGDVARDVVRAGGWWPWPASSGLSMTRDFLDRSLPVPVLDRDRYPEAHADGSVPFMFADAYLAGLAPFFGEVVALPEALALQRLHGSNTWTRSGAGGVDARERHRRRAARQRLEARVVQDALHHRGVDVDLRADDSFRVRQHAWAAGEGGSLPGVLWQTATCPTLPPRVRWRELARTALRRF